MRQVSQFGSLLLMCLLVGCSTPPANIEAPAQSPESVVTQAAMDEFGVPEESVTLRHLTAGESADTYPVWELTVQLASVPDTAAVDAAAAGVLASVAPIDSSDAPVYLTVVAKQLRPQGSTYEWGSLAYYWGWMGRGGSYDRGTEVTLLYGEAADPSGPVDAGMLISEERGHWEDVDAETLLEWSDGGAPPSSK